MKLSELDDLKGLSEKEAYEVYKVAVKLFKEENPVPYRKCISTALVGGALGTLIGMLIKDGLIGAQGLPGLLIIAVSAMLGGVFGGFLTMKRLLEHATPYFKQSRDMIGK